MTRKPPWNDEPVIEWDNENEEHVAAHGVASWEIDDLIYLGEYICKNHPKHKKEKKYANRYLLIGKTSGGRELLVIVDKIGLNKIRPVTAG